MEQGTCNFLLIFTQNISTQMGQEPWNMIRRDFEDRGFPINKRCPVVCTTESGQIFLAYNQYSLNLILKNKKIKKCIGIWPGKINTDCFLLNVESYTKLPGPPKEHQKINDSTEIKIFYKNRIEFEKLSYIDELSDGSKIKIESFDQNLKDYVIKTGLKYINIYSEIK